MKELNDNAVPATYRDIHTITAEIRLIQENVQLYVSQATMKIGEKLTEAKELLPHGEFTEWAKTEFGWSERKTQQIMQIYREFTGSQTNLFAPDIKAQTFADLPFSKLLLLTYVPESEREQFVEENNVSDISVRELEKLVKEKKAVEDELHDTSEELEKVNEQYLAARQALAESEKERDYEAQHYAEEIGTARAEGAAEAEKRWSEALNETKIDLKIAEDKKMAAKAAQAEAEAKLKKALDDAEKLKKDMAELKANPEVPQELIDRLKAQYAAQIAEAEEKAAKANEALAEASAKLKVSDPAVAVFEVHFNNVQTEFSTMLNLMSKMDGETAAKLKKAVAATLEFFGKRLADGN